MYGVMTVFFILGYLNTDADLGFLGKNMIEDNPWIDFWNGLLLYNIFFWLYIVQTYALASRGFSLEFIILIEDSETRSLNREEMWEAFGQGRGVDWFVDNKLQECIESGFIKMVDGRLFNTRKGQLCARLFRRLQGFLNVVRIGGD